MRIANNVAAFNVWSNYTQNVFNMKSSMKKLSTGTISNTDDPAGVGISERMRAQIEGSAMARQNVDNTISMIQTADAWLQKVNDQLSRMKSLSIEASGVMSDLDKSNIQIEFKQMQDEITRITSKYNAAGKFNGLYLFRGGDGIGISTGAGDRIDTSKNLSVQIGPDVNQNFQITLQNLDVRNTAVVGSVHTYGYNSLHIVTSSSHTSVQWGSVIDSGKISSTSTDAIGKIDKAVDFVANARAVYAAQQNRLENTRESLLTYEDNLRAAESKIRDVDMARETTLFAKYQILTNASNAMLAQANQLPGSVLQLLG